MNTPLTRRQQAVYDFLRRHHHRFGHPPTLDELCRALGLRSRGSLHKHVQALVEAGLVEPMEGKRRGVRVREREPGSDRRGDAIPFVGYIAAGRPVEALENPEPVEVPSRLRGRGESYVLEVRGESMIEAGIRDGDWVVIERRDHARNGDIVVALIDGSEATLKRIEQRPGRVVLYPANSALEPTIYPPERVRIQGVVVGQMRKYG